MKERSAQAITIRPGGAAAAASERKKSKSARPQPSTPVTATVLTLTTLSAMGCGWFLTNREPVRQEETAATRQYPAGETLRAQLPHQHSS